MDSSLRNEYNDWYNQYNYTSLGLSTKEQDPEYDESTYTEKLISPVADILGIPLQNITLQDVIEVLKFVKKSDFHFFWRVADLVAKYSISLPPEQRREKLSKPFNDFLKGHTACYIMTKGGTPVIGYAKKRGDLVGVDPAKFARLGAVSKLRGSLSNLKGILSTEPSKMNEVNRKMVREMGRVGIITNRNLKSEVLPIPDKKGGVKEVKVTVLSDCLPSYAVCNLVACLPEALRNEYPNPYKAALEFAKTSSDSKYSGLVTELQLLVGEASESGKDVSADIDAYLKSIGYDDKTITAIKEKDVVSGDAVDKVLSSAGIKLNNIQRMVKGQISQEDMYTETLMSILNIDADAARNLIIDGISNQSNSTTDKKAAAQSYISSIKPELVLNLQRSLNIDQSDADKVITCICNTVLEGVDVLNINQLCNSLIGSRDAIEILSSTMDTNAKEAEDIMQYAKADDKSSTRIYNRINDKIWGEVKNIFYKMGVVASSDELMRYSESGTLHSYITTQYLNRHGFNEVRTSDLDEWLQALKDSEISEETVKKVLNKFLVIDEDYIKAGAACLKLNQNTEKRLFTSEEVRKMEQKIQYTLEQAGLGTKIAEMVLAENPNAADIKLAISKADIEPPIEKLVAVVIGALKIFGVTDNSYAQEYINYIQSDAAPTLRLYTKEFVSEKIKKAVEAHANYLSQEEKQYISSEYIDNNRDTWASEIQSSTSLNKHSAGNLIDNIYNIVVHGVNEQYITEMYAILADSYANGSKDISLEQLTGIVIKALEIFGVTDNSYAQEYIRYVQSDEFPTRRLYTDKDMKNANSNVDSGEIADMLVATGAVSKNQALDLLRPIYFEHVSAEDKTKTALYMDIKQDVLDTIDYNLDEAGVDSKTIKELLSDDANIDMIRTNLKATFGINDSKDIPLEDKTIIVMQALKLFGITDNLYVQDYINYVQSDTPTQAQLYTADAFNYVLNNAGLSMNATEAIMASKSKSLKDIIIEDYLKSMGITTITKDGGIQWTDDMSPAARVSQGVPAGLESDKAYQMAERLLLFMRVNIVSGVDPEFKAKVVPLQRLLLPSFLAAPDGLGTIAFLCDGVIDEIDDDNIKGVVRECKQILQN